MYFEPITEVVRANSIGASYLLYWSFEPITEVVHTNTITT